MNIRNLTKTQLELLMEAVDHQIETSRSAFQEETDYKTRRDIGNSLDKWTGLRNHIVQNTTTVV